MRRRDPVDLAGLREHIRHRYEEVEGVAWDPDGPGAPAGRSRRGLPADPIGHGLDVLRDINISMTISVAEKIEVLRTLVHEAPRFCRVAEAVDVVAELVKGWTNPDLKAAGIKTLGQLDEDGRSLAVLEPLAQHPRYGEGATEAIAEIERRCETVDVERDGYRRQRSREDSEFAEIEVARLRHGPAKSSVPALILHLHSPHLRVVTAALAALARFGSDAAAAEDEVRAIVERETDRELLGAARRTLRAIRGD